MKAAWLWRGFFAGVLVLSCCAGEQAELVLESDTAVAQLGVIERVDPRFNELVPADAVIEKLADGFDWAEGPAWIPDGGFLVFSDVPQNVVYKWKEGEGISEFLKPSGFTGSGEPGREPGSNGLLLDLEIFLVGFSVSVRTTPFSEGFAIDVPFQSGFEVHGLIPGTQVFLSLAVAAEIESTADWYLMAGGGIGFLY